MNFSSSDFQNAISAVANCPVPVVAAIHSHCLGAGVDLTTQQSLLLNDLWTMATTLNSNDLKEAMTAFMEKRPATFNGT
jgi:enoyl-CoA hydratase/carnithine racemase